MGHRVWNLHRKLRGRGTDTFVVGYERQGWKSLAWFTPGVLARDSSDGCMASCNRIAPNFTKAITLPPRRYPRYWMPSPLAWAPWSTLFAHVVIELSEGKTKRQDASIRSTAVSCLVVVAYALPLPRLTKLIK